MIPRALTFVANKTGSVIDKRHHGINALFARHGLAPEIIPQHLDALLGQLAESILSDEGWQEVHSEGGIHVGVGTPYSYRCEAELRAVDIDDAVELISSPERRQTWDDSMEDRRLLQQVDHNTAIVHVCMRTVWPLSSRTAVLLQQRHMFANGSFVVVSRSARPEESAFPEEPSSRDAVKMHVWMAADICLPTSEHSFRLVQVFRADPKGYLPPTIIQRAISICVPQCVERLTGLLRQAEVENGDIEGQLLLLMKRVEAIETRLLAREKRLWSAWLPTVVSAGTAAFFLFDWLMNRRRRLPPT